MKIIIAGSRVLKDVFYNGLVAVMQDMAKRGFVPTEIVSGGAAGVDKMGERWAEEKAIPVRVFEANWATGNDAGIKRNEEMAAYADALIAIWDGHSDGTQHMIKTMIALGKPTVMVRLAFMSKIMVPVATEDQPRLWTPDASLEV